MEYKYVSVKILNDEITTTQREVIFVFPKLINHDVFFRHLHSVPIEVNWREWEKMELQLLGAGFTDMRQCYGRSETLDINSRGDADSVLLGYVPPVETKPITNKHDSLDKIEEPVSSKRTTLEKNALNQLKTSKEKKRAARKLRGW